MERNISAGNQGIPKQTKEAVTSFFYWEDIVYTEPGMKDTITIWKGGKKETLWKYYLTLYLHEAFAIYKETHPDLLVGFSSFCRLWPDNVLLIKDMQADQCKGRPHENFYLKLKGLNIDYDNSWWKQCLCSEENLSNFNDS